LFGLFSLQHLNVGGCSDGYSTSRTCEMSLSNHSGINFRGLVYLVDEATKAKPAAQQAQQQQQQQQQQQ
jgi:D-lactate dehydrogenase